MKKVRVMLLLIATTLVLFGCNKSTPEETQALTESEAPETEAPTESETPIETESETEQGLREGQMYSYLTGLPVDETIGLHRPIAVMLNNIKIAVPQAGIANADIVYEAPVEGGITRLMGIFEDYQDLEKIGSVRSSREYYIFYAREFDAIYVHYGQAIYAVPYLELADTHNLSGLSGIGSQIFYRTSDRVAPHNAYTSAEGINKGIELEGYSTDYADDYNGHYQFAIEEMSVVLDGITANVVTPGYAVNSPWFEYKDGQYYRYQYGEEQIDELTDEQLSYTNIILQYSSYTNHDANGYLNIDTTSGGSGKYITGGKAIDITWSKETEWGVTRYYDSNNEEITLNPGKTWVCIILNSSVDNVRITEE